jgi:hypothetical protein
MNHPGCDACMRIEQKDAPFVQWLWDLFDSIRIVGVPPKARDRTDHKRNFSWTTTYFATFSLPFFTVLFYQWYRQVDGKNVKVLPPNIGELFTPVVFAFLICGDASYHKRDGCIHIYTNSFTPAEVDLLRSILLTNLNIESTRNVANRAKEQYIIRIPKGEVGKLQELVKPHIPSIMHYRVGL